MKLSAEDIVMNLVVNGGDARSKALEALTAAREGDFEAADRLLEESVASANKAHQFQTELLQTEMDEENPDKVEFSILLIHGQDHLMTAITTQELVRELIEFMKKQYKKAS